MKRQVQVPYQNRLGRKHQLIRVAWAVVWTLLGRPFPRSVCNAWKCQLLRWFGAKIARGAVVYSSAKIYYPANLEMCEYSCLASEVNCYNVDKVKIGAYATVSQGANLCTASHDITSRDHHLITAPIVIGTHAWVATEAFVGMGVTIGEGAVVGARAAVFKHVDPWTIVGGNPAKFIKKRIFQD